MRGQLTVLLLLLLLTIEACSSGVDRGRADEPESKTAQETGDRTERTSPNESNEEGAIRLSRSGSTCHFEVEWQIGQIDERFDLSPTDIERAMRRVQELWGGAVERFELTRAPDRGIVIDFQYDDRQELVDSESDYQKRLREQEILIERRQSDFEEKRSRFERANQAFQQRADEIQKQVDRLNDWVRDVNDGGGFTDEQLARFEAEQEAIDQRQLTELAHQTELEELARESNQAMESVNEAIDQRNEMIDHYNDTFAGQRLFTSGHFQRSNGRDTITIYQFQGETGLQRVLAHEIGHAMGLSHIENPEAIMYERISGHSTPVTLRLTADDRNALRQRCMALQP